MSATLHEIRRRVSYLYTAPFRRESALGDLSIAQAERRRRSQLFQLVAVTLTGVQALSLAGQMASNAPASVLQAQVLALALGALCIALSIAGRTILASVL